MLTRVIEQRLVLAFFGGGNQIPDEALDLVITFIMSQTVNQQSSVWEKVIAIVNTLNISHRNTNYIYLVAVYIPTDHLHVSLSQVPFKPTMV